MRPRARRTARAAWTQDAERGNTWLLRFMVWLSLRLGRAPTRLLLRVIALYFVVFAPKARRASGVYLRRALGRRPRWRELWRHMFTFATTIHDRLYLLRGDLGAFDIRLHGAEIVDQALADGQGVFLVGAHCGSFEVLRAVSRRRPGMRVVMAMYEANARKISAALQAVAPGAAPDVLALGLPDSMLRLSEELDRGAVVGMLADRALREDTRLSVPFLGAGVCWPLGPWRLAALLRRPVVMALGLHRGGNRYDVEFRQIADFSRIERGAREAAIREAVQVYVGALEQACAEAPYNWFNFFDVWNGADCGAGAKR